jgi:hypothetical protein
MSGRGHGKGRGGANPPITLEKLINTQNQMMQMFMQHMQNNLPAGGPPPVQVRDKREEFLKGRPPVFFHAADPLEADDWVRAVEKQLNIAQCNDMEKVLFASSQLQGTTQACWESYEAARPNNAPLSLGMNLLEIFELIIFRRV